MSGTNLLKSVLLVLVLGTSLSACEAVSGRETAGEYVDDTTISTKIKATLFDDLALKAFDIHVETMRGIVQLSGFVNSGGAKEHAGEVARAIHGVRGVRNDLVVR